MEPILSVVFYLSEAGNEPVREWLKSLDKEARKKIGEDIKLVQYRWPLGMPLVRKIDTDLWEIRSHLHNNQIARLFFTVKKHEMVLLHGYIKQSQKTPKNELNTAYNRKKQWLNG
jgi:phage-related protein